MARLKKVQSKRQTLHQKYKIQKKVKEAHRKSKKDAALGGKKLKKDPGIPNLWPFKEEFIHKLQLAKEKGEEEKARQKEDRKKEVEKRRKETKTAINGIQSLASSASARTEEFEANSMKKGKEEEYMKTVPNHLQFKDGSKKAYFREFKKIIEHADVVLEVLDARDPLGCRCLDIEKKILTKDPNKKIILILNKVDLIPKENIEQWLKYLRNEYPTIAFKCSTQSQKKNLGQGTGSIKDTSAHALESSESLGAENLLQLLKNYARNLNLKTSVTVGIIGYPNVGKSSLINSLKRTRAVGVGSTPGFTKTVQQVQLDKNIKLLDCPGIVFGNTTNSDNDVILRNAVKVEQIPDPIEPVEAILKRVKTEQMMTLFQISEFKTTTEFLIQIAMRRGKLAQGGVANLKEAARTVLQDWNAGKIPFYTVPPKVKNVHLSSTVVSTWGKEFDIDSIIKQEKESLSTLSSTKNQGKFMAMTPGDTEQDVMLDDDENEDEDVEGEDMNDEDDDQIEDEDEEEEDMEEMEDDIAPQIEIKKSGKKTNVNTPTVAPTSKSNKAQKLFDKNEEAANPQKNKNMKANLKKQKKNAKKNAKNKNFESEEEEEEEDDQEEVPVKSKATSKSTKSSKKGSKNESYDFGEYFGNDDGDMEDDDIRLSDI